MTSTNDNILALDVGGSRIGVARADTMMRIAQPLKTVLVDGSELAHIKELVAQLRPVVIVVGYPRNQSGDTTEQTRVVERFAATLDPLGVPVAFQDESLTSVIAEQRLKERRTVYTKADIDAEAATIILQDYLESRYGH